MKFNERLKNMRKRFKVTQKSLSEYLGITLRTYQRYEEGKIEPPLSNVSAIAKYFDMPVDCLLGNGFYANWEEIIPYKEEIINALHDSLPDVSSFFNLSSMTECELSRFLPAVFDKIVIDGSNITLYESSSISADEHQTNPPEHPSS